MTSLDIYVTGCVIGAQVEKIIELEERIGVLEARNETLLKLLRFNNVVAISPVISEEDRK